MPAVIAYHAKDPAEELWDRIKKTAAYDPETSGINVEFFANSVVVAVYHRPDRTASGLYLTNTASGTKGEDRYQGKVGLVIALGPLAYVDDASRKFSEDEIVYKGDWVFFNPNDGWSCHLAAAESNGSVLLRIFTEDQIKGRVSAPDVVW